MFVTLCGLTMLFSLAALGQRSTVSNKTNNSGPGQCRDVQLKIRHASEDAAMGGRRSVEYAFKNASTTPCTLKGYPRLELLTRSGARAGKIRVVNSEKLPGDEEKQLPTLVRLEPGKEARFHIYFNSGGAGYVGKPCPTAARVRITAPGAKKGVVLRDQIQSCESIQVSAVQ